MVTLNFLKSLLPTTGARTFSPTYPKGYKDKPPVYEASTASFVICQKSYEWTAFISKNLNNLYPTKSKANYNDGLPIYFKIKGFDNFVIVFMYTWMWHIYRGQNVEQILYKTREGGQSNCADYLTPTELRTGIKIQNWYIDFLDKQGYVIENCGYSVYESIKRK